MSTITLNQTAPAAPVAKAAADGGSHWYGYEAAKGWYPLYTPEKNYTMREARKDQEAGKVVVPSVTTIFGVLAKPQLEKWKMENVAKACWEQNKVLIYTNCEEWTEDAITTASQASRGAMDLGTAIHQAIEDAIAGKDWNAELDAYVQPVLKERNIRGITESITEQCVGSLKYGYAGRGDDRTDSTRTFRDYKSRKSKGKKVPVYETDPIQISAYGFATWGNEFFKSGKGEIWGISTSEPGLLTVHEFSGKELIPAFETFLSLCAVWRSISKFDPRARS